MRAEFNPASFTAACLAAAEGGSALESVSEAVDRNQVHWGRVCRVASAHLVTTGVSFSLRNSPVWPGLPADLRQYLTVILDFNRVRNQALRAETRHVIALLNELSMIPVLLKGTAGILSGLYPDPGYRVVTDIDLLLPADQGRKAWEALRATGYQTQEEAHRIPCNESRHHLLPLIRPEAGIRVEIHHSLSGAAGWPDFLAGPALLETACSLPVEGLNARQLSPQRRAAYNIFHSAVQHRRGSRPNLSLRQLRDLVLLSLSEDSIQWPEIESLCRRSVHWEVCSSYVSAARNWFPGHNISWSTAPAGGKPAASPGAAPRFSWPGEVDASLRLGLVSLRRLVAGHIRQPISLFRTIWNRLSSRAWWRLHWEGVVTRVYQDARDLEVQRKHVSKT